MELRQRPSWAFPVILSGPVNAAFGSRNAASASFRAVILGATGLGGGLCRQPRPRRSLRERAGQRQGGSLNGREAEPRLTSPTSRRRADVGWSWARTAGSVLYDEKNFRIFLDLS